MVYPIAEMEETATTYLFTTAQFLRMAEEGILPRDVRFELLDGEVVRMSPAGPRHAATLDVIGQIFGPLRTRSRLRTQCPIELDDHGLPEPDFVLVRPRPDLYAGAHPGPGDVLLLLEVADSSLPDDRERKGPIYATHGISEYWIVNLVEDRLEVHRRPEPGRYGELRTLGAGDTLTPLAFPDFAVAVADLLP